MKLFLDSLSIYLFKEFNLVNVYDCYDTNDRKYLKLLSKDTSHNTQSSQPYGISDYMQLLIKAIA